MRSSLVVRAGSIALVTALLVAFGCGGNEPSPRTPKGPGSTAAVCGFTCAAPNIVTCIDKCKAPLVVGAVCDPNPCADSPWTCGPGLLCKKTEAGYYCAEGPALGQACARTTPEEDVCQAGLVCGATTCGGTAACTVPRGVGAACDSDLRFPMCFPCQAGTACIPSLANRGLRTTGFCQKICAEPKDCPCNHAGTCQVFNPSAFPGHCCSEGGSACDTTADCCGPDLLCIAGKCAAGEAGVSPQ